MDALKIRKWVAFHLDGNGHPDFHLVDHNPGYLAHTFQLELVVPPEVADHLTRKLPCVLLDKKGNPVGECPNAKDAE
jgi:hypothetical protein